MIHSTGWHSHKFPLSLQQAAGPGQPPQDLLPLIHFQGTEAPTSRHTTLLCPLSAGLSKGPAARSAGTAQVGGWQRLKEGQANQAGFLDKLPCHRSTEPAQERGRGLQGSGCQGAEGRDRSRAEARISLTRVGGSEENSLNVVL